jgi:hypothetical protein
VNACATWPAIQIRIAATFNELGQHEHALQVAERVVPKARAAWGTVSWPHVNAFQARGVALDALVVSDADRRRAEGEYLRYRELRDQTEADSRSPGPRVCHADLVAHGASRRCRG